ncbi:MAG: MFS transporter [Alphaproteobacteria bacterium]
MSVAAAGTVGGRKLRLVISASTAGTVFEWYDFFIFGALAPVIAKQFFAGVNETAAFIFALLTFGVGFAVRPIGALVFGRIGDRIGRKYAFLATITIMGLATFAVGLLPAYESAGIYAPLLLISMRMLQGFAIGGEYGGAAIYVAEHAPHKYRGRQTSWIQASAIGGLFAALAIILWTRLTVGEAAFDSWGWRVPFLISIFLFLGSLWIRLKLEESPVFRKIVEEGRASKTPLAEAFLQWKNLKIVLIALFGLLCAQGVVWYTAYFYTQFFLERVLKVEPAAVNFMMMGAVLASGVLYLFFGWLSDYVGRKPIMIMGIVLTAIGLFPLFHQLTEAANPALAAAQERAPVTVVADPGTCSLQFDPVGQAEFKSSCDIAKNALASAGISYHNEKAAAGEIARVLVGPTVVDSVEGRTLSREELDEAKSAFAARLKETLAAAGYPEKADPSAVDTSMVVAILLVLMAFAAMLYGPMAAALVELFPTRIRYSGLSLPYHLGIGWFGGFLPATSFAMVAATGDIYFGLWYPVTVSAVSAVIALIYLPETRERDINA